MADGTEHFGSTVDDAVPAFERFLFPEDDAPASNDDGNTPDPSEQPAPTADEATEEQPDDSEPRTEQGDDEGESDDSATTETADSTDELPPDFLTRKVKQVIDGKEVELTVEEALRGYSRTADYTRKTQELAAQRKALEPEVSAVRAERQKYATLLAQLEQTVSASMGQEPNWTELQQSMKPDEFAVAYANWQIRQNELNRITAEKDKAAAAVRRDQMAQRDAHLAAEEAKLVEAIPEWKDATVASGDKAKLAAYATSAFGWTADDLEAVEDHRNIVLLRKAMLYDELVAKRPAVQQKIERVKAATPGSSAKPKPPVSNATKARQRLAKTGNVNDFAAALEADPDFQG